jgi:pyrroloquinoline quinone biosynthesis protein B
VRPRTQASLAVSADGARWVLLNASPDLPFQIASAPCLWPKAGAARHSPIAAVVISGGDVDCIAGLLSLREGQKLAVYADPFVRKIFDENGIFRVLDRRFVSFNGLPAGQLTGADGAELGLSVEPFAVPGKVPLYQERSDDIAALSAADAVIGLCVSDGVSRVFYVPGCAAVEQKLRGRLRAGDVLFFDGTLWRDDEMILAGSGTKTGARMGHISISGPGGSIAAFDGVEGVRKIFIHINNTNPILCDDSEEAAFVRAAGWEIAYDGMELLL